MLRGIKLVGPFSPSYNHSPCLCVSPCLTSHEIVHCATLSDWYVCPAAETQQPPVGTIISCPISVCCLALISSSSTSGTRFLIFRQVCISHSRQTSWFVVCRKERPQEGHTDHVWSVGAKAVNHSLTWRRGLHHVVDVPLKSFVARLFECNVSKCYTMSATGIDAPVCWYDWVLLWRRINHRVHQKWLHHSLPVHWTMHNATGSSVSMNAIVCKIWTKPHISATPFWHECNFLCLWQSPPSFAYTMDLFSRSFSWLPSHECDPVYCELRWWVCRTMRHYCVPWLAQTYSLLWPL